MKLHLPYQLRNALMACACSVAAVGTTLTTGALVGGTIVAAFSGAAMADAETLTYDGSEGTTTPTWTADGADEGVFTDGDSASFTAGTTEVTLGSSVVADSVTVAADATATILANDSDYTLTATTVTNSGTLNIASDTTVTTYSTSSTGTIQVADGATLTITSTSDYNSNSNFNLLSLLQAAKSSEGYNGSVILNEMVQCGSYREAGTIDISGNYILRGGMTINSWNWWGTGQNLRVLEGASLVAQAADGTRQDISILSHQQLTVMGGTVTAKSITLGHDSVAGNPGTLLIESGTVNVDYIYMQNDGSNLLKMTGGTLNILSNTWSNGSGTSDGAFRLLSDSSEIQLLGGTVGSVSQGWWAKLRDNTKMTLGGNGLEFSGSNDITIAGGVAYFAGTVTNNVSAILQLTSNSYIVENAALLDHTELSAPESDVNGYGTAQYWLVKKGDNGGTFKAGDLSTVTVNGTETGFTVDNGSAYFTAAGTVYYVNVDEVNHADVTSGTSAYVLGGGQLNVATGTAVTQAITVNAASTVYGEATSGTDHAGLTGGITGTANLTINSAADTASDNGSHGNFFALSGDINLGSANLIIGSGVVRLGSAN